MSASGPCWRITGIRRETRGGAQRVVADVEGSPVWFESADAELDPSPEAFASLLFVPALHHGATVRVDAPLDPTWLEGTRRLPAMFADWWGYRNTYPIEAPEPGQPASDRVKEAAACFTGGVDSFYTLRTSGDRFGRLMFMHGYDIALADHVRMASFERSLGEVSERVGKPALRLESNVREHPVIASVSWERTHGAVLAAAGHVLSRAVGTLIIPSSYGLSNIIPWGSHPTTDPLWSTSRVEIVHDDARPTRQDKIRRIVDDPLAWRHLRVCWENRAPTGNCSACEKCVRTMAVISAYGRLADFTVFDSSVSLASRFDTLRTIPEHLVKPWRGLLTLDLAPDVRDAVARLLKRSEQGGMVRRMAQWVRRVLRPRGG